MLFSLKTFTPGEVELQEFKHLASQPNSVIAIIAAVCIFKAEDRAECEKRKDDLAISSFSHPLDSLLTPRRDFQLRLPDLGRLPESRRAL